MAGGFWQSNAVSATGWERGSIVEFEAEKPNPPTAYPHYTEDRVVVGAVKNKGALRKPECHELLAETAAKDLDALFDGNLQIDGSKAYVAPGTQCCSLGGIEVAGGGVSLEQYVNFEGKERLRLRFISSGKSLAPNLTSTRAYEAYRAGRIDELKKTVARAKRLSPQNRASSSFSCSPESVLFAGQWHLHIGIGLLRWKAVKS